MAQQNLHVWKGLNEKTLSVDDTQTLAALRTTLQSQSFMTGGDRFLYYDRMSEKELTLDDLSIEFTPACE